MNDRDTAFLAALLDMLRPVLPWLTTLFLSALATAAQVAQRLRAGEPWSPRNALLDLIVCTFVGLLTHLMCEKAGMDGVTRSLLVAISAHMGTRALGQYERFRDRVFGPGPVDKP
jgi:hypothetical protein